MTAQAPASLINFDASQAAFFRDDARVQVVNWHRQKGKDFTASFKAVDGAIRTGDNWYIVSLTQRQADETFAKCVKAAKAFKQMMRLHGQLTFSEEKFVEFDKTLDREFIWTAREIRFPNGAKVVSLPGRDPDTLAGFTGNLILTEFGLFPNGGYDHWSVLFPIVTRGNYKVIVISTPRGKNTKFYDLFSQPDVYSVHFCDIYQSVEQEGYVLKDQDGQPCDIEAFRKLYNDEAKWPREYECQFTGDLDALITYAQIQAAAQRGAGRRFDLLKITGDNANGWTRDFFSGSDIRDAKHGRFEIGWDVARTSDISSLWVNHTLPGEPAHLRYLVVMHKSTFALQREIVRGAMSQNVKHVGAGDATGLGMDSNETLQAEFGDQRWIPFTFTSRGKSDLASLGRTAFDTADQSIPPMDGEAAFVATDLQAVQCDRSSDLLKLEEGLNPLLPESHCDIAYSCFLARRARNLAPARPRITLI